MDGIHAGNPIDGSFGDADDAINGIIVDPSGLVGNISVETDLSEFSTRPDSDTEASGCFIGAAVE